MNVGFVIEPAKAIGITLFFVYAMKGSLTREMKGKYSGPFYIFFVYTIFITLLNIPIWPEDPSQVQGFFYSKWMRGPVQIFQVMIGLSIIVLILRSVRSIADTELALRVTIYAMIAICLYGLYIWFAQRYGLPYNTINRAGESGGKNIISAIVGGERVARAYSLTGEPKSLASNAVLLIALVFFSLNKWQGRYSVPKLTAVVAALGLVTLFLTYSTAGFVILALVFFAATLSSVWLPPMRKSLPLQCSFFGLLILAAYFYYGNELAPMISEVFSSRVSERLGGEGLFTYAEASMLSYFKDWPPHILFGVGLGGSAFYIRLYDIYSYSGNIAAPRGLVGFISDRGIIGLSLFLYAYASALKPIAKRARLHDEKAIIYARIYIFAIVALILIFTSARWYFQWFTIGILLASAQLAHNDLKLHWVKNYRTNKNRFKIHR
ncbi:hypothetical protein N9850_01540 [Granulosicoccus sp.]|nr:hypothetical protein [Granulosicoccus sp.]MDB4222424.1 hypothetical protein [Granulosicoccus sp.]